MNTLTVTGKGTFNDTVLQSGKIERRLGLISDELPTDTLTFFVYKEVARSSVQYLLDSNRKPLVTSDGHFLAVRRSGGQAIDSAVPGDEILVYYTDSDNKTVRLGQFFIKTIETVNSILFKISCYSYLGILHKSIHEGGVYSNVEALTLIDELTYPARAYGFTYTVDEDVTELNDTVSGWLPYGNCADNLLHVLFATGWVLTPAPGSERGYILTTPGKQSNTIPNSNTRRERIYDQGGITRLDNAETVRLVEHSFFSSPADIEKTLFDNSSDTSAANNAIIVFSEPCHGDPDTGEFITTGTLEVSESGDNYAVVSGNGTLTGYAYSHSQRQIEAETNVINNGKVVSVENETLVSFTNSKNVLERLVNNQNAYQLSRVKFRPIALGNPYYFNQVGDRLTYTDGGNTARTGYINSIDYVMSGYPAINADVLLGFTPGPYGMSVNTYVMFDGAGEYSWTVPTGVTEITAVLIGGGSGGTGGDGGERGGDGIAVTGLAGDNPTATGGIGGNGGNGGAAGSAGKIYTTAISVTPGTRVSIQIGAGGLGGDGGTRNGGEGDPGEVGEDTEITIGSSTYSSASGSVLPAGYSNPLTGETYGTNGADGSAGGKGGGANQSNASQAGGFNSGDPGEDYSTTYNGDSDHRTYYRMFGYGGGGGGGTESGAEVAGDGVFGDASYRVNNPLLFLYAHGGNGGIGADGNTAQTRVTNAGCGGDGGEGGGGGGGGGGAKIVWGTGDWTDISEVYPGEGSSGGYGGGGGDGADGGVIFYYRAS